MKRQSFQPPERILMGPGPSDVHPRVLEAMARPTIGHLDPQFVSLMDEIMSGLREVFLTENELTMPVSGPGSAGQEACVVNLVEPGDKVLVCINGVFGGRLTEMARRAGAEVVTVDQEWGQAIDPDALRAELQRQSDVKVVMFVHAETSTGVLSDAAALSAIAHEHGALVLADTVTSLGGVPVRLDEWGIDACYSGTQKCLSAPPGLSPISLSPAARKVMAERTTPVQSWFLDLSLVVGYWEGGSSGKRSYHHTAPVNALYGLHESILMVLEEGLENVWARHRRAHEAMAAGLDAMGLGISVAAADRIPQLNAVSIPSGVDEARVRSRLLNEYGIEIGAGLGPMAGKIWRVGLMGQSATVGHVEKMLAAVEAILGEEGADIERGSAVPAARAAVA